MSEPKPAPTWTDVASALSATILAFGDLAVTGNIEDNTWDLTPRARAFFDVVLARR